MIDWHREMNELSKADKLLIGNKSPTKQKPEMSESEKLSRLILAALPSPTDGTDPAWLELYNYMVDLGFDQVKYNGIEFSSIELIHIAFVASMSLATVVLKVEEVGG